MIGNMGRWIEFFDEEEFDPLINTLEDSGFDIDTILSPFMLSSIWDLKVIIVGDEPHHDPLLDIGIPFGEATVDISPGLKLLRDSLPAPQLFTEFDFSMYNWLDQGVLMLNAALSIDYEGSSSHIDLWEPTMNSFFRNISSELNSLIFVLLGPHAWKFERFIDQTKKHLIIKDKHPREAVIENPNYKYSFFHTIDEYLAQEGEFVEWYY